MSDARRRVTLLLGVVALLALVLAAAPPAHGQESAVEVRVAAQRLLGGNTEFALQERQANGEWAERRLPRGRFFPADTRVGRWLGSSPLTIALQPDSMSTAAGDSGLEVRVAAQLLADGRMEFALEERRADGEWEERRLPTRRIFPANATVGRWLSSSSLTVEVPSDSMLAATPEPSGTCVLAENVDRVTSATFQVQTAAGYGTAFYIGDAEWITNHHVVDTVSSASLVHGGTRLTATVTGSLPGYDLALLRAQPPASVGALSFAGSRPELASDLMVVGFPVWVSSTPSVTRGAVSKHAPFSSHYPGRAGVVVQVDAAVNPGNSGGPIVDNCGAVIGVATFGYDAAPSGRPVEGINFGVAAETVAGQLPSLRSSAHYARRVPSAAAPVATALEISALCSGNWDSSDDCQAAAASGLDTGDPGIWARGVEEWDNLYYSIDELEGRDYLSLRDLGRGRHTLQINERRAGGWTGWSAPYTFTITGAAPMEIRAICNGDWADYSTSDDCFAAGSGGILAEDSPVIWTLGVAEWANILYSIDGGAALARADLNLRNFAAGFHTIHVSEQQAAGWTGWSEPYAFTITGAAPIEITAICNRNGDESSDDCHAAGCERHPRQRQALDMETRHSERCQRPLQHRRGCGGQVGRLHPSKSHARAAPGPPQRAAACWMDGLVGAVLVHHPRRRAAGDSGVLRRPGRWPRNIRGVSRIARNSGRPPLALASWRPGLGRPAGQRRRGSGSRMGRPQPAEPRAWPAQHPHPRAADGRLDRLVGAVLVHD